MQGVLHADIIYTLTLSTRVLHVRSALHVDIVYTLTFSTR